MTSCFMMVWLGSSTMPFAPVEPLTCRVMSSLSTPWDAKPVPATARRVRIYLDSLRYSSAYALQASDATADQLILRPIFLAFFCAVAIINLVDDGIVIFTRIALPSGSSFSMLVDPFR